MPAHIGRYEVVRPLKGGGMGSVTLCKSPDGSLVVLKRPYSHDEDAAVRLRDEARLGARLLHPAIVDTLDLFEDGPTPVLVVAYVDGLSLENLRAAGPLPPGAVARIGRQIAEALDALHQARDDDGSPLHILHRDVTPGNIVIDRFGDAKLIDLGIARFRGRQAEQTQAGFLRGTMRYLAPELLCGGTFSHATDLWALGLVLWEAAVGRHAYPGDGGREILAGILRGEPMELLSGEVVDERLTAAIAPLLEVDPERRERRALEAAQRFAALEEAFGDTRSQTADAVARARALEEAKARAKAQREAMRKEEPSLPSGPRALSATDVGLDTTCAELPQAPPPLGGSAVLGDESVLEAVTDAELVLPGEARAKALPAFFEAAPTQAVPKPIRFDEQKPEPAPEPTRVEPPPPLPEKEKKPIVQKVLKLDDVVALMEDE